MENFNNIEADQDRDCCTGIAVTVVLGEVSVAEGGVPVTSGYLTVVTATLPRDLPSLLFILHWWLSGDWWGPLWTTSPGRSSPPHPPPLQPSFTSVPTQQTQTDAGIDASN